MVRLKLICVVVLSLFCISCNFSSSLFTPSNFAIEVLDVVGDIDSEDLWVELDVTNSSSRDISILEAKVTIQIKGDDLLTLLLVEGFDVEAVSQSRKITQWRVLRDDPTTLYAMRRHSIDRYIDRLTFGYDVRVDGVARRERRFTRSGLKAQDFNINGLNAQNINFEKLLQQKLQQ